MLVSARSGRFDLVARVFEMAALVYVGAPRWFAFSSFGACVTLRHWEVDRQSV